MKNVLIIKYLVFLFIVFNNNSTMAQLKKLQTDLLPEVQVDKSYKLTKDITIIPDPRINYVPNIGIIEGSKAILVVDAGMGPENGRKVFEKAKEIANGRKIYLTTTHFHPEHSFGASAFNEGGATVLMNKLQSDELSKKGHEYLEMFRSFGELERTVLQGTKLAKVDEVYSGKKILDLGGKEVELYEMPAHTLGDQVIFVKEDNVVFMGDLIEERFFPIMPDNDTKPSEWIEVIKQTKALKPKIVVPGHGDVGGTELLNYFKNYLVMVKNDVKKEIDQGKSREETIKILKDKLTAAEPTWDNKIFIPYQIAHFYAELTKRPVVLPDLKIELKED